MVFEREEGPGDSSGAFGLEVAITSRFPFELTRLPARFITYPKGQQAKHKGVQKGRGVVVAAPVLFFSNLAL